VERVPMEPPTLMVFGASVDHIPVKEVVRDGERVALTEGQRRHRVFRTRENAERFINLVRDRRAGFTPVGTIQALSPSGYAATAQHYFDLGYRHIAIGGLVPKQDKDIEQIVEAVVEAADDLTSRMWIHVFGVFRPKLQERFRELRIDSFDSATYFRKAWLRSDQNYLARNGQWYAAIRVPMTSDGRTKNRLEMGVQEQESLEAEEAHVLRLLNDYDQGAASLESVLDAVLAYDSHLTRSSDSNPMRDAYRKTLKDKPWTTCGCPFCKAVGIHMLLFRGSNRNKRRGAHNTLMLYDSVRCL